MAADTAMTACFCGHISRNHIGGQGLCLYCRHPICLIYRPDPGRPTTTKRAGTS
jgi:hypothetical protein